MKADSKAAEGALQSTIHLPKQLFLLFKVVREQRKIFLSPFLRSVSFPQILPLQPCCFPRCHPKKWDSALLWLCPVLIHGAVNICTRVCCSPQGWVIQTQPLLMPTSGLCFPLCLPPPPALPQGSVWAGDLAAQSLTLSQPSCSQRTLLTMCCINSAQSGSSSQSPKPN